MSELPLYIVDAFTAIPFRGNPASVCLATEPMPDAAMQAVAAEMNHSETAFIRPVDGPLASASRFSLRWFTPETEVPLCGHGTLAAAAVIFRELGNSSSCVEFETKGGILSARREEPRITLDFPAGSYEPAATDPAIVKALGARDVKSAWHARDGRNLLLHLGSEEEVRSLAPDFPRLREARGQAAFLGVIATAPASGCYDFVSRYFAPWVGVDEDPATGSTHCVLAPYWAGLTGKMEMLAFQASRRGGEILVRWRGDRVDLSGEAVVVAAGSLRLQ